MRTRVHLILVKIQKIDMLDWLKFIIVPMQDSDTTQVSVAAMALPVEPAEEPVEPLESTDVPLPLHPDDPAELEVVVYATRTLQSLRRSQ